MAGNRESHSNMALSMLSDRNMASIPVNKRKREHKIDAISERSRTREACVLFTIIGGSIIDDNRTLLL